MQVSSGSGNLDVAFAGGLFIGDGGNFTAANELDDYEEGLFGVSATGQTTVAGAGTYTKVGRMVTFNIFFSCDTADTGTEPLYIGGLPFTNEGKRFQCAVVIYNGDAVAGNSMETFGNGTFLSGEVAASGDSFAIRSNSTDVNPYQKTGLLDSDTVIFVSGSYMAAT
jgi:hypothetical protein